MSAPGSRERRALHRSPAVMVLAGVDGEWHDASEVYAGAHYPHGH